MNSDCSRNEAVLKLADMAEKIKTGEYLVESIGSDEVFTKTEAGKDLWSVTNINIRFRRY